MVELFAVTLYQISSNTDPVPQLPRPPGCRQLGKGSQEGVASLGKTKEVQLHSSNVKEVAPAQLSLAGGPP